MRDTWKSYKFVRVLLSHVRLLCSSCITNLQSFINSRKVESYLLIRSYFVRIVLFPHQILLFPQHVVWYMNHNFSKQFFSMCILLVFALFVVLYCFRLSTLKLVLIYLSWFFKTIILCYEIVLGSLSQCLLLDRSDEYLKLMVFSLSCSD